MDASSRTLRADVFADYFQFYLWDQAVAPDAPTDWTDEDVANRVKAAPHVVVVCPVRNTAVPVHLWPAPSRSLRVLEQWRGAGGT